MKKRKKENICITASDWNSFEETVKFELETRKSRMEDGNYHRVTLESSRDETRKSVTRGIVTVSG